MSPGDQLFGAFIDVIVAVLSNFVSSVLDVFVNTFIMPFFAGIAGM